MRTRSISLTRSSRRRACRRVWDQAARNHGIRLFERATDCWKGLLEAHRHGLLRLRANAGQRADHLLGFLASEVPIARLHEPLERLRVGHQLTEVQFHERDAAFFAAVCGVGLHERALRLHGDAHLRVLEHHARHAHLPGGVGRIPGRFFAAPVHLDEVSWVGRAAEVHRQRGGGAGGEVERDGRFRSCVGRFFAGRFFAGTVVAGVHLQLGGEAHRPHVVEGVHGAVASFSEALHAHEAHAFSELGGAGAHLLFREQPGSGGVGRPARGVARRSHRTHKLSRHRVELGGLHDGAAAVGVDLQDRRKDPAATKQRGWGPRRGVQGTGPLPHDGHLLGLRRAAGL